MPSSTQLRPLIVHVGDTRLYFFTPPYAVQVNTFSQGSELTVHHAGAVYRFWLDGKDKLDALGYLIVGEVHAQAMEND